MQERPTILTPMSYMTRQFADPATGLALYELRGPDGSQATIAPGLGGNCISWRVDGQEVLFSPPLAELAQRPTRGGIPILFPFPNRIRDGRFAWASKAYQLERNDSTGANAIHGFTPRSEWTVADCQADSAGARISLQFDIPANWPAPGRITIAVTLTGRSLRCNATIGAIGNSPFPFGLGYHPYFAISPGDRIQSPASARWELDAGLPTGTILPLDSRFDLTSPRPVDDLTLDDVYTGFPPANGESPELIERGRVLYGDGRSLSVRASPAFRELVLLTPPHRKAVCLEPYTCPTDAVNLTNRGLDVGWIVLPPGRTWTGAVVYELHR